METQTAIEYKWKVAPKGSMPAQDVGERIEYLAESEGGRITPSLLVADASNLASPLHDCFEWDDTIAAHKHRLEQAKFVLRMIIRVEQSSDEKPVEIRAFVSITENDDKHYATIEHVMNDDELRSQLVATALAELRCWSARYENIREFAKIHKVIKQLTA